MSMLPQRVVVFDDRTRQSAKAECDINGIVSRFAKGQMVTHLAKGVPAYLDVSEVGTYREALDRMMSAKEFFEGLPSKVRTAFRNDAALFVDAVHDPSQAPLLESLGLVPGKAKGEPLVAAPPVPPAGG